MLRKLTREALNKYRDIIADKSKLARIKERLKQSPLGDDLLNKFTGKIIFRNLDFGSGSYVYASDTIILSRDSDEDELVTTLAHELRHSEQNKAGMSKSNSLSIKSQIMLNRYIEADAQCVEFRVEAELRMANDGIDLESTKSRQQLKELQDYEFKAFYRDTGRVTTYDYSVVEHSLAIERFSENDHFETIIKTFRDSASHTEYADGWRNDDFADRNYTRINPSLRKNIENSLSSHKEEHQKQLNLIINCFWTGNEELDSVYIDNQRQKEFDLIQKELWEIHKMASNPHRPGEYKDKSHHTLTMIGDANYLSKEEYQQAMNFLVDCDFIASEQVTIKKDEATLQRPDFN